MSSCLGRVIVHGRVIVRLIAAVMIVLTLLAGCGKSKPTATPVPPTATPAPTNTPTATSTPVPTNTPTRTPIPTTAPYDKIPEQTDDGWQTASLLDVGIDPVWINKMLEHIYQGRSSDARYLPNGGPKYQKFHSILIVKDGLLVFEEYFHYYHREDRQDIASITKSMTSLLVGLAIEQGYLDGVDEKVLPYFPEYLPLEQQDERKEDITIEDLLTMRHGTTCDDWDPASPAYYKKDILFEQPDLIQATLNLPLETTPGSQYSYCTASTVVLGAVLARATEMKISEFAKQYLFGPLGIKNAVWVSLRGGWTNAGGGMLMRSRDMARVGLMMLQNGNWNGEQIVPEDWVQQSVQEHVSLESEENWGSGYGYLWWLGDVRIVGSKVRSFTALGSGGQVITVFPKLNMVVVITGSHYDNDEGKQFEIMERFILPAVLGY